jgi:hypothetical protein
MRRNKKGDLSLSINAIVILILAITMLGLGLAFMRNIFGSATKEFQEVGGTVKKQMIDQMKESDKVVDLSNPKVTLKAGEQKQGFIGFKNDGNIEKNFQIRGIESTKLGNDNIALCNVTANSAGNVTCAAPLGGIMGLICGVKETNRQQFQIYLEFKSTPTTVKGGDVVVLPFNIKAVSNAPAPTSCTFEIKVDSTALDTPTTPNYDEVVELTVDVSS